VLESEWSPNLDIVIPYGITVKTRFVTKPPTPFETISTYSYKPTKTKKSKRKQKKAKEKVSIGPHVGVHPVVLPFSSFVLLPSPIQTEGKEN
jgi:hypothetical protein